MVWAIAYFVEASVLVIVIQAESTGTALTFNRITPGLTSVLLIGWTLWWGNRLRADKPAEDSTEDPTDDSTEGPIEGPTEGPIEGPPTTLARGSVRRSAR